ncbi:MAG: porin [Alphaproteobacteria bacterium]|nr:porin [Alphaproteobacteria bacterium]
MDHRKIALKATLSLGLILSLQAQVFANAAPAAGGCCEDHKARLKKLEDRAVMSVANKVVLSGTVYRGILWMDNGAHSNLTHVDNGNATSRFNITGTGALTDSLSVQGIFEVGMGSNDSDSVNVNRSMTSRDAQMGMRVRKSEIAFKHTKWGQLSMGRGWMVQAIGPIIGDMTGTDTASVGMAGPLNTAGSVTFVTKAGQATNYNQIAVFNDGGFIRKDRVRYDSPSFYGFSAHTSHAHHNRGDMADVALNYSGAFSGTKVSGFLSWGKDNTLENQNSKYHVTHANLGVLVPVSYSKKENTGLAFNVVGLRKKTNKVSVKGNVLFAKAGWIERFVSVGNTAFAVDYGRFKNMAYNPTTPTNRPVGKTWALTMSQSLDVVSSEVHATYRNYALKVKGSGVAYKKVNAVMLGASVKM